MSRPLRIQFPGAVYHVTSRGNTRQDIYLSNGDRRVFLRILGNVCERLAWRCYCYALMDNHYHLVIETAKANLAQGMRQLNGVYTQHFNHEHERTGHLFEGRYTAVLVERDSQSLEVIRYVLNNPVQAGLVRRVEDWRWSSLNMTMGVEPSPRWMAARWVLGQFGEDRVRARQRLLAFVRDGHRQGSTPYENVKGDVFCGSDEFVRKHRRKLADAEIPRTQRNPLRRRLDLLLRRGGTPEEVLAAYREGYRMVEIATHLGVHYTTVSQRLKRAGRTLYVKT